jgi:DNA-binding protein Fis
VQDGPGALYYRNQMDHRSKNPVYSNSLEELEERLLEDILNYIDCHPWAEMK